MERRKDIPRKVRRFESKYARRLTNLSEELSGAHNSYAKTRFSQLAQVVERGIRVGAIDINQGIGRLAVTADQSRQNSSSAEIATYFRYQSDFYSAALHGLNNTGDDTVPEGRLPEDYPTQETVAQP